LLTADDDAGEELAELVVTFDDRKVFFSSSWPRLNADLSKLYLLFVDSLVDGDGSDTSLKIDKRSCTKSERKIDFRYLDLFN